MSLLRPLETSSQRLSKMFHLSCLADFEYTSGMPRNIRKHFNKEELVKSGFKTESNVSEYKSSAKCFFPPKLKYSIGQKGY